MSWLNNDGLTVRFGGEQGTASAVGKKLTKGDTQELVLKVVGVDLPDIASPTIYDDVGIPQGAHIMSATFYVDVAFAGTSGTLTFGVWSDDGDGTFTVVDADGIDATIAVTAIDAIGDQVACDGDMTSAPETKIAVSNNTRPVFLSAGRDASNPFTAGSGRLVVKYRL